MSDFVKQVVLAIAAPLAGAVGEMAMDEVNARRAERMRSRDRWEALIAQARAERVAP